MALLRKVNKVGEFVREGRSIGLVVCMAEGFMLGFGLSGVGVLGLVYFVVWCFSFFALCG